MVRRTYWPQLGLASDPAQRVGEKSRLGRESSGPGAPSSVASSIVPPVGGSSSIPPPSGGGTTETRRSVLPPPLPGFDGISVYACAQLLDRISTADDAAFICGWIEATAVGRSRPEPPMLVRLLRAYREVAAFGKARDLVVALPSVPVSWGALDVARLATERSLLSVVDGRYDLAEAELRLAGRMLATAPKGTGAREQLDVHIAQAEVELRLGRPANAASALRLAEHVIARVEDGPWMTSAFLTLGLLSMQMSEPREAIKHLSAALSRAPAEGLSAIQAHANIAIALASVGRCTEGRSHALSAVRMASVTAPGSQHADAYDILATVELAADRPAQALAAIEEAAAALGSLEGTGIRGSLALHRAQALCMQNEGDLAETWCARAEVLAKENSPLDRIEEQDLTALRARVLEAKGLLRDAMEFALAHVEALSETFSTCALNLVVGRCALALGDHAAALTAVEGVALVGDRLGYVFPDRTLTKSLWELALTCGDSRVIRYAERVLHLQDVGDADDVPWAMSRASCRPGASAPSLSPSEGGMTASEKDLSSPLMYVTTPDGVIRVAQRDIAEVIKSATLVVDTLAHRLRVQDREISLERRRAIEPLVVHLLRRAKDGLSADDVLRAAGGPGPESADAEHRVRVLISRIRHILRDSSAVERVRDAGEYGRTRYRIAASVRFALIEPLHTTN